MTIHTRKLPTFALYAAYADDFRVPVFGSTRDEAINNLADELAAHWVGEYPVRQSLVDGGGSDQPAREGKSV